MHYDNAISPVPLQAHREVLMVSSYNVYVFTCVTSGWRTSHQQQATSVNGSVRDMNKRSHGDVSRAYRSEPVIVTLRKCSS